MRYFDVADISDANKILFYEFKSVIKVPPAHFADQFLKDLSNKDVTSLEQIKWIFDGKKNPENFKLNMEKAINNLFNSKDANIQKQLKQVSEKMTGFEDIDILKSEIMDDFTKIFNKVG